MNDHNPPSAQDGNTDTKSPESNNTKSNFNQLIWQTRWFQIVLGVLVLAVTAGVIIPPILQLIYTLRGVLVPVVVALGLAYVFNPLVSWLDENKNISRATSSGLIIALFMGALLALVLLILPPVIIQGNALLNSLKTQVPELVATASNTDKNEEVANTQEQNVSTPNTPDENTPQQGGQQNTTQTSESTTITIELGNGNQSDESQSSPATSGLLNSETNFSTSDEVLGEQDAALHFNIKDIWHVLRSKDPQQRQELMQTLASALQDVELSTLAHATWTSLDIGSDFLGTAFGFVAYISLSGLVTAFAFYFFSWRFHGVLAWCIPFIPAPYRDETLRILRMMNMTTTAFIRGRLVQTFVMGLVLSVGWAIVGVPYWLLLGVAGGLLNLIPFVAVIMWPLAIGLAWLEHMSGNQGFSLMAVVVWPSVVYGIAQGLDGWVIEPVVQGKATNLNPLAVFLAVMAGAALAGLLGMLLAIPAAACAKILMDEIILPKLRSMAAKGDPEFVAAQQAKQQAKQANAHKRRK